MGVPELQELVDGRKGKEMVAGLLPGEICFVGTDQGVFEVRECIERRIGGEVLVRVQ